MVFSTKSTPHPPVKDGAGIGVRDTHQLYNKNLQNEQKLTKLLEICYSKELDAYFIPESISKEMRDCVQLHKQKCV